MKIRQWLTKPYPSTQFEDNPFYNRLECIKFLFFVWLPMMALLITILLFAFNKIIL